MMLEIGGDIFENNLGIEQMIKMVSQLPEWLKDQIQLPT